MRRSFLYLALILIIIPQFSLQQSCGTNKVLNSQGQCVCDSQRQYVKHPANSNCLYYNCDAIYPDTYPVSATMNPTNYQITYTCQCSNGLVIDYSQFMCVSCKPNSHAEGNNCVCNAGYQENTTTKNCDPISVPTGPQKCHESCNCETVDDGCASCHKCSSCKQPDMATMIEVDYCVCKTPDYVLKAGSTWECEPTGTPKDPKCDWQLYNSVVNMVVHSKCTIEKDSNHQQTVQDIIQYDWARVSGVALEQQCKDELKVRLLWSKDCVAYIAFNPDYYVTQTNSSGNRETVLRVPLIDLYDLTSVLVQTDKTINQTVCMQLELSNQTNPIRLHRFQLRVYTNRNQVQTFHLDVSSQVTDGCDKGQECIVVANLDTRGYVCEDQSCATFKNNAVTPSYVVGDNMFVRIAFADNTYKKYLTVTRLVFVDDNGIYTYQDGVQYWTIRQSLGSVDVKILLFQPYIHATIQVSLKIAVHQDPQRLRVLEGQEGDETQQKFNVEVYNSLKKKEDQKLTKESVSFAQSLRFLACSLLAFLLLF